MKWVSSKVSLFQQRHTVHENTKREFDELPILSKVQDSVSFYIQSKMYRRKWLPSKLGINLKCVVCCFVFLWLGIS